MALVILWPGGDNLEMLYSQPFNDVKGFRLTLKMSFLIDPSLATASFCIKVG